MQDMGTVDLYQDVSFGPTNAQGNAAVLRRTLHSRGAVPVDETKKVAACVHTQRLLRRVVIAI